MTEVVFTFIIAFFFSFIGTIPPGTLNLTIVQLGLEQKITVAWRMSLAAAIIEYPYAWLAVEFQDVIMKQIEITIGFRLLAALVMILLGAVSLLSSMRPSRFSQRFNASGFRKGVVLALLNPMAIPFWIAMTAYLKAYGWVDLSSHYEVHAYLLGVSIGTLVLCMLLAYLAGKVVSHFSTNNFLQKTPGIVLILLGLYAFVGYIFG